ncbi:hypothetical protein CPB83DRAFT_831272 [Crepidotus variabilis]|uniref:Uncharacterized protein n=1 Tax=Crepidotus variabilis TaxID=179855 RepID=A0A9P6EQD4_9AGAR|nr:hypothetical protein CPB83DRAFT_831272 [Crepidotus variabilis]
MTTDKKVDQETHFACKCLNVRIRASPQPWVGPDYPRDPSYTPVFVKDDGITVVHTQVTVRQSSRPEPIPGSSKYSRFTAVTCLLCNIPIYRVYHAIALEVEGNAPSLLPSEEWVEREILKSLTGWVDVHTSALVGETVSKAESSDSFVQAFSVLLPEASVSTSPPEPCDDGGRTYPKEDSSAEKIDKPTYLPFTKPVFLPPPFTPSNPIFVHLAGIANTRSKEMRNASETRIQEFVALEAAAIEEKENLIKHQAECLWRVFKQNLEDVQLERGRASRAARSPSQPNDPQSTNGAVNHHLPGSSVAVTNFIPTPIPSSAQHISSPSHPRVSALSASLAASTFHHPKYTRSHSPSADSSSSHESGRSHTLSTRSGSSTLVHSEQKGEGSNVLQFKRNINDDINTQASYRYFVNLEEDMQRFKRAQQEEDSKKAPNGILAAAAPDQTTASSSKVVNSTKTTSDPTVVPPSPKAAAESTAHPDTTTPPRGRDKGKRKVTFDVEPAVVTIGKEEKVRDETPGEDPREIIFPLDDVSIEDNAEKSMTEPTQTNTVTLPLLEQPPPRPVHVKRRSLTAATEAFQNLRPSSLPAPSHVRPIRSQPGVDSSSQSMMLGLPRVVGSHLRHSSTTSPPPASPTSERDSALMKLVAADTPSHRGNWKPGSQSWTSLTSNEAKIESDEESEAEEQGAVASSAPVSVKRKIVDASDDEVEDPEPSKIVPVVGSLPVKIKKREAPKLLSLSSYVEPGAVPRDQHQPSSSAPPVNGKRPSAASMRKAMYAEKDRARPMDPGVLDFVVEDDEEGDSLAEAELATAKDEGEKARKQALMILQARSELPEEGMWRSLAT